MSESERSEEEQTTELIPKVETSAGTPQTMEFSGQTPVVTAEPEPEIPRKPFVPPELLARRQPAPHSAALTLPFYQQGSVLTASPTGPATSSVDVQRGTAYGARPGAIGGAQDGVPPGGPAAGESTAGGLSRRSLLLAGAAVVVVIAVVAAIVLLLHNGKPAAAPAKRSTAPAVSLAPLKATVTSFDPTPGGSGFRRVGSAYRTQVYTTATFGNLKRGLGLALDLGSAKTVSSISFRADDGPFTVQLYAADQAASTLSGYTAVGSSTSADGPTTFSATAGGKHQHWLIWVTRLGSDPGGYAAQISRITVKGQG